MSVESDTTLGPLNEPDPIDDLADVDSSEDDSTDDESFSPHNDYLDPTTFFTAIGMPMPRLPSPGQVRKEAKDFSAQIFSDWDLLKSILDRHEATIHKRWAKKTKNQRAEILLAAWPNMPARHRPDFAAWGKETDQQIRTGTKFRETYLWPYVNLEDFAKPKTLLLSLQARARNTPDAFAFADYDATKFGRATGAIIPAFLNLYTMMFTNRKTPKTYGQLYSWSENEHASDWYLNGKGLPPGMGLLVLEIQQRFIHFLVECCKRIMHDVPAGDLASDRYPIQPGVVLEMETINGFDSLAVMAEEAPYRLPASVDLARLQTLLAAKKSAAEDHLWALREDPGYFAETLFEFREHRLEELYDVDGRAHPLLSPGREKTYWAQIMSNALGTAQLKLEVWSDLYTQVKNLSALQTKYQAIISVDEDLPDEYLDALLNFQHYLKIAVKGVMGELAHNAPASLPLRPFFVRLRPKDAESTRIQVIQKRTKLDKGQAEFFWLLRILWEDAHELFLMGLTNAVDEFERLVQGDPSVKALISPYMANVIADLSVFGEGLRQLERYQPWANRFEDLLVHKEGDIKKRFAQMGPTWKLLLAPLDGPNKERSVQLGEPKGRKFYYPVDERRTKATVEAMRSAEKNLDAFWMSVDRSMRARMGSKLKGTAVWRLLSQSRILQRTPEWVEPENQVKRSVEVLVITKPLSELYFDLEHRTERTVERSAKIAKSLAPKRKTKGVAAPLTPTVEPPPSAQVDVQPKFQVDLRALKVFRTLFYTPSLSATPGEVAWTDFLHAMVSVSFKPEKLYGSVWQFSPTTLDMERSIHFHEPHPSGRLPYTTARRYGRRLDRAYGWSGDMFVPKSAGA